MTEWASFAAGDEKNGKMQGMTTSVHFSIKYDGPALASHQMDVRELAPALMALANLLEDANKAAFPGSSEVRVQVKGTFKSGSFGIDLIADQTITQQLVSLFSGSEATAAANLLALLGGIGMTAKAFGGGLIGLIRWLNGRRPTSIRNDGDKVVFEIQTEEVLESYTVDLVAGKLYQDRTVRQSLAKVIKPLEREGIDYLAIIESDETLGAIITSDEVAAFTSAASQADVVSDTISERLLLQIESAVFRDGNKWRLSDGGQPFYAEIVDVAFLSQIDAGQARFGKGDVLVADLRQVQTVTDTGLKMDRYVVKVHEHRSALQASLL